MSSDWQFETKAIHGGGKADNEFGGTMPPIHMSAAYSYPSAESLQNVFEGKEFGYIYSRISNPTVSQAERLITQIEGGRGSILTSSGMSAISVAIFALVSAGDQIVSSKSLFGGTKDFFEELLKRSGVSVVYVDSQDPDGFRNAITEKTRLIFVESVGNPKLDIPDYQALSEIASAAGIPLIVDSTLTSPVLFNGKTSGAHIVIHSTTKYLTGNGTAIGGVIVDTGLMKWKNSTLPTIQSVANQMGDMAFLGYARSKVFINLGVCPSPFNAFQIYAGIETLPLRVERQCENALKLAQYLKSHPEVSKVSYPGLADHPNHELAKTHFKNRFGGLLTVRLGTKDRCFKLIKGFKIVSHLANLGDSRTLVIHPASTIYNKYSIPDREACGAPEDLIRVSVGIENVTDLIRDFEQALATLNSEN